MAYKKIVKAFWSLRFLDQKRQIVLIIFLLALCSDVKKIRVDYMEIDKALEVLFSINIEIFDLDLFVLVFKRAESWVSIKFVFGLDIN